MDCVHVQAAKVKADRVFGIGAVDVDILEKDVFRMDHGHGPHLALHKADALKSAV